VTLVLSGADETAEGPRTRVSFRCTLHVEESGSDWPNSLGRAKTAFAATHPTASDLFDWSVSNRMGQMLVSLETTTVDDECRIASSMRSSTVSELVFDAVLLLESEADVFSLDVIADEARAAIDELFTKDAIALASCSIESGVVIASATVDVALQTGLVRIDGGQS